MSKLVLTNAQVFVNSVDISNHVQSVNIESQRDEVDVTSMGDTSKEIVLGLGDVTFTVTVFNDYAVGNIDSQMFALHTTNTPFAVEVRPVNGSRSTWNPWLYDHGAPAAVQPDQRDCGGCRYYGSRLPQCGSDWSGEEHGMTETTIERRRYKLAYPFTNQDMCEWVREQFDIDPSFCSKIVLTIDANLAVTAELHMFAHPDVFLKMPHLERSDD